MQMPECEKVRTVQQVSQAIGEFLDWLHHEKGWFIAEEHRHDDSCYERIALDEDEGEVQKVCGMLDGQLISVSFSTVQLLAEFFGIDLAKVEAEKRALLAELVSEGQ